MEEDGEFEVTADMLIHGEVDDEQTMVEEEALQSREEVEEEVAGLQQESEIPLEKLLQKYGYSFPSQDLGREGDVKEERSMADVTTAGEMEGKDGVRESEDEERKLDSAEEVGDKSNKPRGRLKRKRKPTSTRAGSREKTLRLHSDTSTNSVCSPVGVQSSSLSSPPSTDTDRGDDPTVPDINHLVSHNEEAAGHSPTCTEVPVLTIESRQTEYDFPASTSELEIGKPLLPSEMAVGVECHSRLGESVELQLLCEEGGEGGEGGDVAGESNGSHTLLHSEENVSATVCGEGGSVPLLGELEKDKDSTVVSSSSSSGERTRIRSSSQTDPKSRLRPEPERRSMRLMANDEKALDLYFSSFLDDDEGDEDYVPVEEWKQEIRVGCGFQAEVSDCPSQLPYRAAGAGSSAGAGAETGDKLLWRPQNSDETVVCYLAEVAEAIKPGSENNSQDTEQALQLLQECGHDTKTALNVVQQNGLPAGNRVWTEEECVQFEQGLRLTGKDFYQLKDQVPSRTVKELVEFYYFWKKSKRYDDFIQHGKLGKKKVVLQPGQMSDFMDNYLNLQDPEVADLHYATTTVFAEHKKEAL